MADKPKYFVTRSFDSAILGKDGRWAKRFSDPADIKLYASCGHALKHGLGRIPESMRKECQSIGTCHAVYPNERVTASGGIIDINGGRIGHRGTIN